MQQNFVYLILTISLFVIGGTNTIQAQITNFEKHKTNLEKSGEFYHDKIHSSIDSIFHNWSGSSKQDRIWEIQFSEDYFDSLLVEIVNNFKLSTVDNFSGGSIKIEKGDENKYYKSIFPNLTFSKKVQRNFLKLKVIPSEILINGEVVDFYPEDRVIKMNERGILGFSGGFHQRISVNMKNELSGPIILKGVVKVSLMAEMEFFELKEGETLRIDSVNISYTKTADKKAFLVIDDAEKLKEHYDYFIACLDEKGTCYSCTKYTILTKAFNSLKAMETFDETIFGQHVQAISETDKSKIKIILPEFDLSKLIIYRPNKEKILTKEVTIEISNQ